MENNNNNKGESFHGCFKIIENFVCKHYFNTKGKKISQNILYYVI